jgi:Ring finger domain
MQAKRDQAEVALIYNYTSMSSIPSSTLSQTFSIFDNPIYGITNDDSGPLLNELVSYSGNMSSVPMGSNLTALYDPLDYVRLSLTIDTGQGSSLPGLWLFLLVILAALGLIIASTSISMHVSQYRARRDLRRRIAAGEIDLESLGIKRLTVPKEMIDALPIRIYGASTSPRIPPPASTRPSSEKRFSVESSSRQSTLVPDPKSTAVKPDTAEIESKPAPTEAPAISFEQPQNCAICLDDHVVDVTPVRYLPCNHIFHPHCIDPFLSTRSSLCPLCKRSVLPKGFVPPALQLTNATVARERRIRLLRERSSRRRSGRPADVEMATMGQSPGQAVNAPTQEEEDDELRRRGFGRRMLENVFPRFTRPTGTFGRFTRRSPSGGGT